MFKKEKTDRKTEKPDILSAKTEKPIPKMTKTVKPKTPMFPLISMFYVTSANNTT